MVGALLFFVSVFAIRFFFIFILYLFKITKNGLPTKYQLLVNFNNLYDVVLDILTKRNGTFLLRGIWFSNVDMLLTSDHKNIHYITTTNFSNYPKGLESKEIFDILGISLFNVDFDEWTSHRKLLHAYLKNPQFHKFLNKVIVENVNNELMPVLEHFATHGMVVDFQDVLKRHLLDIAWFFSTGFELKTLTIDFPENPFGKAFDDACQAMYYRNIFPPIIWKTQRWLGIGIEKKLHAAKKTAQKLIQNCMSKKKDDLKKKEEKNGEGKESFEFLKYLIEEGEPPYPEQLIRDDVIGFIFAIYDTTSTSLSWFFWLLSKNPKAKEKIREEIKTCFLASSQGRISKWKVEKKEDLSKLIYLQSAICETLRLYPPAPFQHRTSVKADVLPSGHQVAPKTRVVMSGFSVGRMASIWGEDCLEFKPERWIDGNGKFKYEKSAKFFAFNSGPRICPGKDIALSIMKAIAASVVRNYHVEVVETAPIIPKASIVLDMKHGMRVRFTALR